MGASLVGVLTAVLAVASTPGAPLKVVVVLADDAPSFQLARDAFVRQLGTESGRPIEATDRRVSTLTDGPIEADVVFALGTSAARHVATAPFGGARVFAVVGDPLGAGLVDADDKPRTDFSGVSGMVPLAEQLALVHAIAPEAHRVGVVVNAARNGPLFEQLKGVGLRAGMIIVPLQAMKAEDVGAVLRQERDHFDTLLALPDPSVWNGVSLKAAVIFALSERRPLFGFSRAFTRAGAIASISAERYEAMGQQAATLAAQRLAGAPAKVEPAASRSLSVNIVVAQRLGLTLSRELVDRAEDVYR